MLAGMPAKHTAPQAAMKTHLSQSTAAGAFDGQHGMSLAISSIISADISDEVVSDGVISSAIACMGPCEDVAAITGRETGASARPAMTRIASNRRMAKFGFTTGDSHRLVAMERSPISAYATSVKQALIAIKPICVHLGPNQPAITRSAPVLPPGSPARASPP